MKTILKQVQNSAKQPRARTLGLAVPFLAAVFLMVNQRAVCGVPTPPLQWRTVTIAGLPSGSQLGSVWARNRGEAYVTANRTEGNRQEAFLFRWNGTAWEQALVLANEVSVRVYGTGESDVFLATALYPNGPTGASFVRIYRSTNNGVSFARQVLPSAVTNNPAGFAYFGGTQNDVFVHVGVGDILHFNGTTWNLVFRESSRGIYGLTLLGPNEGYYVTCLGWGCWDGTNWAYRGSANVGCDVYGGVWGARSTEGALRMFGIGQNNFNNGVHIWGFDEASQTWGQVFSDGPGGAGTGNGVGIWGSAADDVYAVGELISGPTHSGRVYHFDGTGWMQVTNIPAITRPRGVGGSAANDIWVSLSDGRMLHYASPTVLMVQPYVADPNTVLLDHFDGTTSANILGFANDGAPCGPARPSATPNYSFGAGPVGLDQAITLAPPAGAPVGSGTYLKYPGGELLSQANGTLECWVYLTNYDLYIHQLNYVGECQGDVGGLSLTPTGRLRADIWYTVFDPFGFDSGTNIVPLNTWSHLALSWGSAGAKLYINGAVVGSHPNTGSFASWFGQDSVFVFLGGGNYIDELRISNVARTNFSLFTDRVERHIGTYTVNYHYNAAGRYTDQSNPDYTQANPYYGNHIPPGPIFINATPGRYRIVTEGNTGCSVWSGDSSSGSWYSSYPFVEFDHEFGQIALYFWDWYASDNDPSVQASLAVYEVVTSRITNITVTPIGPVISTRQQQTFTATGSFVIQGNRPLTPSDGASWTSSNTNIATVDANGLVTPTGQGYTTITACKDGVCGSSTLFVTNQPPTVIKPPINQSVRPGADMTWCVDVRGSEPLSLQWQFNGVSIPGATGSCLTVSDASPETAGLFSLVVTNDFGTNKVEAALSLVELKMFAGLIIAGPPGSYRIECMENLGGTNLWTILDTKSVTAEQMPFYFFDTNSPSHTKRFYRSIWLP